MGGGEEEKANKHLFNPPFLAEAENVEVEKTGSVQKRDGIQAVIPAALPSAGAHPMTGTGTLFEHPGGQMGVVGQPDFNYAHSSSHSSLSVVSNSSDFNTSAWVKSNTTGIYSCGIEEDPVVRVDEALIHVQSSVSGNKVITVWCSQVNPITVEECYDGSRTLDNRCYYMVRERDTGTVLISPRRLHSPAHSGFTNNPRYVHIALVDDADPHWVVVAAPELYQDNTQNYLTAASISVSLNTITYNKLSFIDGQTGISTFTAFDMHAGKYSDTPGFSSYAHIIAQAATGSGHSDYIFRIDKTLTVSLFKALATNEVPEPGEVKEVILKPMLLGSVLFMRDSVSVTVPPLALAFDKEYDTIVLPVAVLTKSTPRETGTGQLLVNSNESVPFENEALLKDPNPPPPYVPMLLSFIDGNGALEP